MASQTLPLAFPEPEQPRANIHWFSPRGATVVDEGLVRVYVGGSLVSAFDAGDSVTRDALLVTLSESDGRRLGKLADAFEVSSELLRQLRALRAAEGLEAVVNRRRPGEPTKLTPELRSQMEKLLEEGLTIHAVHAKLTKGRNRIRLSMASVGQVRRDWYLRRRAGATTPITAVADLANSGDGSASLSVGQSRDGELPSSQKGQQEQLEFGETWRDNAPAVGIGSEEQGVEAEPRVSEATAEAIAAPTQADDGTGALRAGATVAIQPAKGMQHAGLWILLGVLAAWGIYDIAASAVSEKQRVAFSKLRVAMDLVVAALAIGQLCVEGVRRLATPTGALLLRTRRIPSAPWVRATLARVAGEGGAMSFHIGVADHFIREGNEAASPERRVVFYVDNHMRHYTGQETIRKGWRMQDRRARPGVTDCYVHDEDGRPLMRMDDPQHEHLTHWLPALAGVLRIGLAPDERILVAFDRGGAFADHLAELRDDGVEFVTYERAPYPEVRSSNFTEEFTDGEERILFSDSRTNLGAGRGRVRRIALLMPTGRQVNLLSVSDASPERLYRIMSGRWGQENSFKHSNERWGINQLDGRQTEPVSATMVIPNPARRRLDRAIAVARESEGRLRCKLSASRADSPRRAEIEAQLEEAVRLVRELVATRPSLPKHSPLEDTDLAGKLVQHTGDYKMWLDTVRIACANAESELAARLAPRLPRPAEAKKVLANLFAAPGDVAISGGRATVTLAPAATHAEKDAIRGLMHQISAMNLVLPGDAHGLKLTFRLQA